MFAHEDGGPEPDWIKTEREQFADFRDLNKDGKMDLDEIRHWIMPQDYDHAQAEARHLVYESDQDKVGLSGAHLSFTPQQHFMSYPNTLFPLFRIKCWPERRSWTTGTCLWEARPPTMVKTSPGTTTSSELAAQQRRACVEWEQGCETASTLLHRCVSTPASWQMSAILNCEAPLETEEGTKICPATHTEGPSQLFFVCLFLSSYGVCFWHSGTEPDVANTCFSINSAFPASEDGLQ